MTFRRGVVVLGVLVAIVVGLVLWRARGDGAPATGAKPTEASRVARTPRVAPRGDRTWLAQRGVAGTRLAGVVLGEDGAPVPGATVRFASDATRAKLAPEPRVRTDAAGRFDFGPQPALAYVVSAEARGLTAAVLRVDTRSPTARADDLRLVLHACIAAIHGTVLDTAGGVIPHARVSIGAMDLATGGAEADDDGAYELCVPPGGTPVTVTAESYATIYDRVNVFGRTRRDFELAPGATVTGRVVRASDSSPVAGALVDLRAVDRGVLLHASTDDDGRFEIAGVAIGRHQLVARADGLATAQPVEVTAALGAAPEDVVCELVAAYEVSGKIVERDGGKPVAGVQIALLRRMRVPGPMLEAVTQADGSFTIAHALPGEYRLGSSALAGASPREVKVVDADVTGVIVEVERRATIAGRVLQAGKPVDGVIVRLENNPSFDVSAHDGSYTLRNVTPGTYTLYAQSDRTGAFTHNTSVTVAGGETKTVDVELDLAGSIEGTVVDQNDRPVAGVFLKFSLLGGTDFGMATTAEDGSFAARALSGGGDYVFEVREREASALVFAPATGKRFPSIAVAGGASHVTGVRIQIRYERFSIAGRVLDASGNPVPDATVRAAPAGVSRVLPAIATTDERGAFTVRDLAAGSYRLQARSVGGEAQTTADAGSTGVELRMTAFAAIEGTLEGFTTTPRVVARDDRQASYFATVTGSTFEVRDLQPGAYTITATSASELGEGHVTVEPGQTAHVTLREVPSGAIEGRVVDATGAPLEGSYCNAVRRDASRSGAWTAANEKTSATGAFRITPMFPGVYDVRCFNAGVARADATVRAGEVTHVDLTQVRREHDDAPSAPNGTLGIELADQLGEVRVQRLEPGGAGARAGVLVGDVVVKVGDRATKGLTAYRVNLMLDGGDVGSSVTFTLERGDKTLVITVVRAAPP